MIVVRKRLVFWLIKAYLRKWGKIIFFSFVAGLVGFFFFVFFSSKLTHFFPQKERIGLVGAYTMTNLPRTISAKLSRGLTKVEENGQVKPDLASFWEIENKGTKYIFHLKKGIRFSNGKELTTDHLTYSFKDVTIAKPDKYTIEFSLKSPYSPFLVTLSRPIFVNGLEGLGSHVIIDLKLNGDNITSLTLAHIHNKRKQIVYLFYPTQDSLKTAFLLGETTQVQGLNDTTLGQIDLSKHKNVKTSVAINYRQLATVFYNTKDQTVSDNKLRKALTYALPDSFQGGERAYLPYAKKSMYFNSDALPGGQDLAHAALLINAILEDTSQKSIPKLKLTTLSRYKKLAEDLKKTWEKIGIEIVVEEVEVRPDIFQMYLGDFMVPQDPDQYILWHSKSNSNITKFDSKRIDKLLEDGRSTIDTNERKKIYAEFQKYLNDDALIDTPASFLYFPYSYTIKRR
ncbi:MAG: ABC transporter substrate-binding protein [Candidatus Levybacteria bacterium]|nr:ABC transporter substrate-binding protein [Candidatus Levybacteria bacterium]